MAKPKADLSAGRQAKISDIPDQVLKQLLTSSEIRMLRNRFQIANLLGDGLSIRKVAEQVKVGTDTVVRVSKLIEKNSLQKAFKKGEGLSFKTSTPWIFGKSDG